MKIRALRESDLPHLRTMAEASGFPYVNPSNAEAVLVVADSQDKPIMACAARKLVELYLWVGDATPATKLAALRLMHHAMAEELRKLGYSSAECFLPPAVEKAFGKRLMRTFNWTRNWISYNIHF